MKNIMQDREKLEKRLTASAHLVLSHCNRVFDLDIWLRKASAEASRLNSKAGDLISALSDSYGIFFRDISAHTADEAAILRTVSDAIKKAEKLEEKADALAEKVTEIISYITSHETTNKGE